MNRKIFTITIILFFTISSIYVNYNYNAVSEENSIESEDDAVVSYPEKNMDTPDRVKNLTDIEYNHTSDNLNNLKIDNENYKGSSITVQYQPTSAYLQDVTIISNDDGVPSATTTINRVKQDDGNYYILLQADNVNDDSVHMEIEGKIKINSPGKLYYNYSICSDTGGCTDNNGAFTITFANILDIVDMDGYMRININALANNAGGFIFGYQYIYGATSDLWWDTYMVDTNTGFLTYLQLKIDMLKFVPDAITSEIRSEYQYTSYATIQHKLNIENWEYNNEITIKKPVNWEYSSISPEATITETAGNIEITGTVPVTYEILFSQQNNYFMAVEDVTDTLTSCIDFECGNNFMVNRINSVGNNGIETQAIVSDIVSQGSYALKLYDTAWGQTSFPTPYLEEGEYYFVYDVYIESGDGYYLWRGTSNRLLSDFEYGRWYTFVEFITITDTFQYSTMPEPTFFSIILDPVFSPITLYIDNLHFLKASGKISTNSYSEYDVTAQFVVVDNIEYPVYTNKEVQLKISERADDTEILKKSVTTDENGIARYNLKSAIKQKEYVIEAVSFDSQFGVRPNIEHANDLSEWVPGGSGSMSQETVLTKDSLAVKYTLTSASSYLNPSWNPTGTSNFLNVDYITFWQYYSSAGSQYNYDLRLTTDGSNYFNQYITNQLSNQEWHHFILDIDDFLTAGSPDITSIDTIYFRFNLGSAIGDFSIYDKLYFIQAQKSYFTPVNSVNFPFSYEEKLTGKNNYFDFSENIRENWGSGGGLTVTPSATSGYLSIRAATTVSLGSIDLDSSTSINADYYTKVLIRAKAEASGIDLKIAQSYGGTLYSSDIYTLTTTFAIYEFDMSWSGTVTNFVIEFAKSSNFLTSDDEFYIDYISIVSSNSSVLFETENSFILSSTNDTRSYYYELDNYSGYATDLEYIPKNMTVGSHTFNYTIIYDSSIDENLLQLPGIWYSYTYKVVEVEPDLTIEYLSFLPLDSYLSFQFGTNWANETASIYENGTLIGSTTEDTVYTWNRNTNYTIKINVTILINKYVLTYWYENAANIDPIEYEVILIYVYDLDGYKFSDVPWDLYYNSSLLDTFALQLEKDTFNSSLLEFRDLFGTSYTGKLVNQTSSISGYKVYQFQIQAYEVSLYNQATDQSTKLALKQNGLWSNYTLSPGEIKSIWVANITTEFYAYVQDVNATLLDTAFELVGSATKTISKKISFGISTSVAALLGNEDITNNNYISDGERETYAIMIDNLFGKKVNIRITWTQLGLPIIIGIITVLFGIIKVISQKFIQVKLDDVWDHKKGRYVKKKRYKLKKNDFNEVKVSNKMMASTFLVVVLLLFSLLSLAF